MQANSKCKAPEARTFSIKQDSEMFVKYFDQMQEKLEALASMDDLLSGMYSTWMFTKLYSPYIFRHVKQIKRSST